MIEKILILLIVGCCAFFTLRRFYKQWKSAIKGDAVPCCSDSCSSCGSVCDDANQVKKR